MNKLSWNITKTLPEHADAVGSVKQLLTVAKSDVSVEQDVLSHFPDRTDGSVVGPP